MDKNHNHSSEIEELYQRINQLEKLEELHKVTEEELRTFNQQLDASYQQMKASEQQLKANEQALNQQKEILDKTSVNKKMRNNLSRIMGEEIPEAIHFITSSTSKMDNLLKGLLTLSRLGHQKFSFQQLNINQMIKQVIDTFKFEIDQNGVEIKIDNLPACTGDELQINQLFSNLIGNSLKFLDPERKGKINISGQKQETECIYIIEDNGIGISGNYQQKMFDLFEKLDPKNQVLDWA